MDAILVVAARRRGGNTYLLWIFTDEAQARAKADKYNAKDGWEAGINSRLAGQKLIIRW